MKLSGMEDADRAVMWAEKAHGAAVRLHHVRGERRNVPRWGAVLYGAEDYEMTEKFPGVT